MFNVRRKDDYTIYPVYSVRSERDSLLFLLCSNNQLKWVDSKDFIPFVDSTCIPWLFEFKETGKKREFYAIEAIVNDQNPNSDSYYLIYYCNDEWIKINETECIILKRSDSYVI